MQIESIALVRLAVAAALLAAPIAAPTDAPTAAPIVDTPAASSAAPTEGPLSHDEIREAVAKVAGDSNLAGRLKSRELRWRQSQAPPANTPSWARGFFGFLAQSMRVLFWMAGAAAAASAAIWLVRWLRALPAAVEPSAAARALSAGGLDIDPDSLPEDIGAAALALLEAERMREALSLLYRGALSRAVHRYGVVIGESYTEGEALRALNAHLDPDRAAYVADLVGVRQRIVYAGESAARETLERLCHGFAPSLDGAAP
jgi:Domain of unknown function (DUF4129)